MTEGKRAGTEYQLSLTPLSVSSSSDHSKHSSVSPPRIIGTFNKRLDGAVQFTQDNRHPCSHPSDRLRLRNVYRTRKYRSRSISRDKSLPKRYQMKSKSRSPPKRYRSRSRSRGRGGGNRRSRSRSKSYRSRRSRSRSQGRQHRSRRSRSRSNGKTSRRGRSRSRSVSSHSKMSSRRLLKSRSRSREHSRRKYKSKSPLLKSGYRGGSVDLRSVWKTYLAELRSLETIQAEEEKFYDKDPEKHPDYKVEWKTFYKGRVQEILNRGDDPKLHNFESEWAYFWKFRMSELIKIDYEKKKVALKRRLKLPDDAEIPSYILQDTVPVSGMPQSYSDSLPSSNRSGCSKGLIPTLRIVTAVEEQLGSLGPAVNALLSEAFGLQRVGGSDPDALLSKPDNYILLETVKEKLLGQIQSKIVKKSLEGAVEKAICSINELLQSSSAANPSLFLNQPVALGEASAWPQGSACEGQVNVPGVGKVDRVAIAQQIAEALVKQGKTDVTEAELQELVNGVVGMVEAQAAQEREREMACLKERLQVQELVKTDIVMDIPDGKKEMPVSSLPVSLNPVAPSDPSLKPDIPVVASNPDGDKKETDALSMLMSVVNSGIKKPEPMEKSHGWSSDDSDEPFTIKRSMVFSNVDKNSGIDPETLGKGDILKSDNEVPKTSEASKKVAPEKPGFSAGFGKKETPKWYQQAKKSPSPEIFKSMKKKVLAAAKSANDRKVLGYNKNLSPFSSRVETSNPLPHSDEEDEDLKVIGAWDSDSDIDLDSFGKDKGLAYDKVNVKRSPDKYKKNLSLLSKSKEVLQNTVVASPASVSTDMNLDAAIDNLMGELKNKTSKIEVISSKPQVTSQAQSPSLTTGQPSKNGQPTLTQTQQMSTTKYVTPQGYNAPYGYPQLQSYGATQQGYYHNTALPGYAQSGGVPFYANGPGTAVSSFYNNHGNLVYCAANEQWPRYYNTQQANLPSNVGNGPNYGKY